MLELHLSPDVFTMTALIDVVGRQEDLGRALHLFHWMRERPSILPNIVTFVTLTRLAGICYDRAQGQSSVFELLDCADELKLQSQQSELHVIAASIATDVSLYNGALAALVRLVDDYDPALQVLRRMHQREVLPNELTIRILAKLILRVSGEGVMAVPSPLAECIGSTTSNEVLEAIHHRLSSKQSGLQQPRPVYGGVLGSETSPSLRQAVLQHDVVKLLDRIDPALGGDPRFLSENDFATLVHQARKRKWADQVGFVLESLLTLSREGWSPRGISPQPQLCPTSIMYSACMNAYFNMGLIEDATELYKRLKGESNAALTADDFVYTIIKGFVQNGQIEWAVDCYFSNERIPDMVRRRRLVLGLLRGLGKRIDFGLEVLHSVTQDPEDSLDSSHILECAYALLTSIAVVGDVEDVETFLLNLRGLSNNPVLSNIMMKEDPIVIYACLLAAVNNGDHTRALLIFRRWSRQDVFLPSRLYIPLVSIIEESFLACPTANDVANAAASRRTLPFRSFAFVGCQRVIESRLSLIQHLLVIEVADSSAFLDNDSSPLYFEMLDRAISSSGHDEYILKWLFKNLSYGSSYLLILYRIHSLQMAVKNRALRENFENVIKDSIHILAVDECEKLAYGIIRCVSSTISLSSTMSISMKSLAKAFRILLDQILHTAQIDTSAVIEILRESSASLEIFKEIAKALSLEKSYQGRMYIAEWCLNELTMKNERLSRIIQFALNTSTACLLRGEAATKAIAKYAALENTDFYACGLFIKGLKEDLWSSEALAMSKAFLEAGDTDLCCKLLIQFNVDTAREPELRRLISATSEILTQDKTSDRDDNKSYLEFDSGIDIVWVDSIDTLEEAVAILNSDIAGMDVEWRPYPPNRLPTKCALLQIAINFKVFLFDLLILENNEDEYLHRLYREFIQSFMQSDVIKVGFGLKNDWARLRESYPNSYFLQLDHLSNAVDLFTQGYKSLSAMAERVLGLPLRKTMQVHNSCSGVSSLTIFRSQIGKLALSVPSKFLTLHWMHLF